MSLIGFMGGDEGLKAIQKRTKSGHVMPVRAQDEIQIDRFYASKSSIQTANMMWYTHSVKGSFNSFHGAYTDAVFMSEINESKWTGIQLYSEVGQTGTPIANPFPVAPHGELELTNTGTLRINCKDTVAIFDVRYFGSYADYMKWLAAPFRNNASKFLPAITLPMNSVNSISSFVSAAVKNLALANHAAYTGMAWATIASKTIPLIHCAAAAKAKLYEEIRVSAGAGAGDYAGVMAHGNVAIYEEFYDSCIETLSNNIPRFEASSSADANVNFSAIGLS